jgi:Uma2 family endonuclease
VSVPVMPRDHDWTVADLDDLPDDGLRYELLDGALVVSPAPSMLHQRVVTRIWSLLNDACPHDLEVFVGPVDWQPDVRTSLQPDVVVASRLDAGPKALTLPLVLAVEVLSPSTRRKDQVWKRIIFEEAGVGAVWFIDPEVPSIETLVLVHGRYERETVATGTEQVTLAHPCRVTLRPSDLVRP